jgi:hypothetical protein
VKVEVELVEEEHGVVESEGRIVGGFGGDGERGDLL